MLIVLGGLAEFERELIRARTGDGRARAKERGVRFGRPAAPMVHQRQEALQRLANGEAPSRHVAIDAALIASVLPAICRAATNQP